MGESDAPLFARRTPVRSAAHPLAWGSSDRCWRRQPSRQSSATPRPGAAGPKIGLNTHRDRGLATADRETNSSDETTNQRSLKGPVPKAASTETRIVDSRGIRIMPHGTVQPCATPNSSAEFTPNNSANYTQAYQRKLTTAASMSVHSASVVCQSVSSTPMCKAVSPLCALSVTLHAQPPLPVTHARCC